MSEKFPTLFLAFAVIVLAYNANVVQATWFRDEAPSEGRLLLTPYIKSGKLDEAKMEALVKWGRDSLEGIPSYTGFLTVNETANTNLFFWFVPSMVEDPEDSPIMVWLNGNGEPGTSSLFGFFVENGPFKVKKRGRIPKLVLRVRKDTWARRHNMLYIDSPVGTGFSFTDDANDYARSQDHVVAHLYSALHQFYQLFPDFAKQELYIAGESYAAKTASHLALHIHQENQQEKAAKMNLKGLVLGGPMLDPPTLTPSYSQYFYSLGLIDDAALEYMKNKENVIQKLTEQGNKSEAYQMKSDLLFSPTSYLSNITGYDNFASVLDTKVHKKRDYYVRFLNQSSTRKLIHVGEQPFLNTSSLVLSHLAPDLEVSYKSDLESLLNNQYRVLLYVGQMDMVTPHLGMSQFLRSLNYTGSSAFTAAPRKIVRDLKRGDVSGYLKAQGNLYYMIVRNAGHHAPSDQPRWCREMVERFVFGKSEDDF